MGELPGERLLALIRPVSLSISVKPIQHPRFSNDSDSKRDEAGSVYFVLRSEYEAPLGHRVVEFCDESVLDWVQNHWPNKELIKAIRRGDDEVPDRRMNEIFGFDVCGFYSVWEAMAAWGKTPPSTEEELAKFFRRIDYGEGELIAIDHAIQAYSDDDEIEICWYLFDRHFAQQFPERIAFLLQDDWRLPEEFSAEGLLLDVEKVRELNPTSNLRRSLLRFSFVNRRSDSFRYYGLLPILWTEAAGVWPISGFSRDSIETL